MAESVGTSAQQHQQRGRRKANNWIHHGLNGAGVPAVTNRDRPRMDCERKEAKTMAKKKATAKKTPPKRPRSGAQKQLAGMEDKVSRKLQSQLEADRDACADKSAADVSAKAARESLINQMEAEGITQVKCPFRDKLIKLEMRPAIKVEALKKVDEGE